MAHWIVELEGPEGWERIKYCNCSNCGQSALLHKEHSMDGISFEYCKSKYCPNCGEEMEELTQNA